MIESARLRILETLPDSAQVLDVGGWAVPFPRADWVIDLEPYETRGRWGYDGDRAEDRFSAATWVARDICDREPWPFEDGQFDFVICSHTLEDVRDPLYVCAEMVRVAKAGYVEVPSRLAEQAWGLQGPWVGWSHHHWIVDVDQDAGALEFVFKSHAIHGNRAEHFADGFAQSLSEEQKVTGFWWEGSFAFSERIFLGWDHLHGYLSEFVAAHGPSGEARPRRRRRLRGIT